MVATRFLVLAAAAPSVASMMMPDWSHIKELNQISADDPRLDEPAVTDELIASLPENRTWTARKNSRFEGATLRDAQKLMGALHDPDFEKFPIKTFSGDEVKDLPTDWDWREESDCASLKEIRDQSECGSCWAFGSVEAMTDRICIQSDGEQTVHLSAQDVTSCCHLADMGCHGGVPPTVYIYWTATGIVSGGNYGDTSMCYSYQKEPCNHHSDANASSYPSCDDVGPDVAPLCANECIDNGADWDGDKNKGAGKTQYDNVDDMMQDLYQNGPITGMFFVKQDFLSYSSGVYDCSNKLSPMLGGHAIKILGFGEEDGTPYWLVANSWNEEWGDEGFFKIRRGENDCQIEDFVLNGGPVGGKPRV